MSVFKQLLLGSCIFTLSLFMLTPGARASEWDQKVVATFDGPVEIPGQVLPTGTYVIKILDVMGTRDVVQVSNADESKVLAMAFAIPRYRPEPTAKPVSVMEERGSDSPQALQAWYYPGFTYGHQFVYAAHFTPAAVAAVSTATPAITPAPAEEPSPAMSDEPIARQPEPETIAQTTPSTDQNEIAQAPDTSTTTPMTSTDQADKELPKTASTTPLIALIGMLLVGGAVGLKTLASRI